MTRWVTVLDSASARYFNQDVEESLRATTARRRRVLQRGAFDANTTTICIELGLPVVWSSLDSHLPLYWLFNFFLDRSLAACLRSLPAGFTTRQRRRRQTVPMPPYFAHLCQSLRFLSTNILQGSIATRLRCDGISNYYILCQKFTPKSAGERILKID